MLSTSCRRINRASYNLNQKLHTVAEKLKAVPFKLFTMYLLVGLSQYELQYKREMNA